MKLFYRQYGQGKPLIILHGLFGMSDNWMTLAKQFGESGFATYAVDLRNHGQSPHSDDFSYELMMQDVVELMDDIATGSSTDSRQAEQLPLPAATAYSLIGHSMGAKVGMLLALQHPDRVEKLIAVDMAPRYYFPHHQYIFNAIHKLGDLSGYASRKEVETNLLPLLPNEQTRQFILKNLYRKKTNEGEKLAWRFNADAIEKNVEDTIITLKATTSFNKPALFIIGEKSSYITAADEPEIKKLFPQVIFETIAGAGHWVHADKPKEFFEVVSGFLKADR